MKEEQSFNHLQFSASSKPEKSFSAAIEQMAQLLRSQVKLTERTTRVLSASSLSVSFQNSLEQIAKLLRAQIQTAKTPKKRSWKKQPSKRKKR